VFDPCKVRKCRATHQATAHYPVSASYHSAAIVSCVDDLVLLEAVVLDALPAWLNVDAFRHFAIMWCVQTMRDRGARMTLA
jgi:hypothetical protein